MHSGRRHHDRRRPGRAVILGDGKKRQAERSVLPHGVDVVRRVDRERHLVIGHRRVVGDLDARPVVACIAAYRHPRQAAMSLGQKDAAGAVGGEVPRQTAAHAAGIRVAAGEGRRRGHERQAAIGAPAAVRVGHLVVAEVQHARIRGREARRRQCRDDRLVIVDRRVAGEERDRRPVCSLIVGEDRVGAAR